MATQPKINAPLKPFSKFTSQSQSLPLKTPNFSIKRKTSYVCLHSFSALNTTRRTAKPNLSASEADPGISEEEGDDEKPTYKEKLGVVVKPMEKPRVVLKFIWMQKFVGIALNQVIPGHSTIPLSPYYFWPREDAWENLKSMLESKPWISRNQMHILLNQATDVINLWQENGGKL